MKTILIVDDDEDDREFLCEAIDSVDKGIRCVCVSDGSHALKLLLSDDFAPPDFIFLDLNMPRMDGKGCLAEIKKSMRLQHIPVIIYSTSKLPMDIEETRELGAAYFLTKPTKYTDLRNALGIILFSKSLDDESLSAYLTSF